MDIYSLVYSGIALSATGTLVYSLRTIPLSLYRKVQNRFIYSVKVYQYDDLFEVVEKWMYKNHNKMYRDVEASLSRVDIIGESDKRELSYKQEETLFVINYEGKKLLVTKGKEKMEKAVSLKELYFRHFVIKGFRAKKAIEQLLEEALESYYRERDPGTIKVYTNNKWGDWYHSGDIPVKPFSNIILPEITREFIYNDLNQFVQNKDWYRTRGIPYKRAYCLHGPPGNGKTSLSLAIAHLQQRHLYLLNIASVEDDASLVKLFSSLGSNSCMVIEDIDKAFNHREAVDARITFSGLLNCLDGALYREGLLTIITTNHIENLDPALIRAGRIDEKIHIDNPSPELISSYLSLFYEADISITSSIEISMSRVQEICMRNKDDYRVAVSQLTERIAEAV